LKFKKKCKPVVTQDRKSLVRAGNVNKTELCWG
jgi:hypothetical protein